MKMDSAARLVRLSLRPSATTREEHSRYVASSIMWSCATTREECTRSVLFSFPYVSAISFPHLFPCQAALKPGSAAKELHSRSVFVHLLSLSLIFFLMRLAVLLPGKDTAGRSFSFFPHLFLLSSLISFLVRPCRGQGLVLPDVGKPGQFQELSLVYLVSFHHLFCLELFLGCL